MTDPYRTAATIEPDEPPGAFAARVVSFIVPRVNLLGLIDAVSARDAAVRRDALDMRPCVLRFALLMERKLRENDHKGGWDEEHEDYLLKRLREETVELSKAINVFAHHASEGVVPRGTKEHVGREAADVANFAMMLADNAGALAGGPNG